MHQKQGQAVQVEWQEQEAKGTATLGCFASSSPAICSGVTLISRCKCCGETKMSPGAQSAREQHRSPVCCAISRPGRA